MVNDNNPVGKLLHILKIMGGQNTCHVLLLVHLVNEIADFDLGDHIKPDSWLIQKQYVRPVQHSHDEFAFHAFPKG
ncbi:hypothetical protein D3C75_1356540 [compost metagenome]